MGCGEEGKKQTNPGIILVGKLERSVDGLDAEEKEEFNSGPSS